MFGNAIAMCKCAENTRNKKNLHIIMNAILIIKMACKSLTIGQFNSCTSLHTRFDLVRNVYGVRVVSTSGTDLR